MKIRLAAALLALPLLAFDCGGEEKDASPFGMTCQLQIRGAEPGVNEDLWCVVAAYDYADISPGSTMWVLNLVAYRGMTAIGGGVGFFHDGRPALATTYGWNGNLSNVDSGGATRYVGDATANPPTLAATHEATAPLSGFGGTGALSVTFTRIPPPGATGAQLLDVHGMLSGTLPALGGASPDVTFSATF
jgi:hypothetical protein